MVTADELTQIQRRMAEAGITNAGAYMRKMALNGYILHVDLDPVKEMVSLQRRCANNLNQVAVHANTFGVYPEEIAALQKDYAALWEPGSSGTMKSSGAGCPMYSRSCLYWWKNDLEGCALMWVHPFISISMDNISNLHKRLQQILYPWI